MHQSGPLAPSEGDTLPTYHEAALSLTTSPVGALALYTIKMYFTLCVTYCVALAIEAVMERL